MEESSPRVSAFGAKKIIAAVVACLIVVAVGVGVAFGMGNASSSQEQGEASNQSAPSVVEAATNTQADNQSVEQPSSENASATEAVGSSSNDQASQGSQVSAGTSSGGTSSVPSSGSASSETASSSEPSSPSAPEPEPASKPSTITVHVYIDSSRAPGYGKCMASKNVTISEGSSVYDALCATGVSVGGSSTYVSSINGLREKLPGHDGSGWMYSVNGEYPMKACGKYKLSGGESIRWSYTLDLGNDL